MAYVELQTSWKVLEQLRFTWYPYVLFVPLLFVLFFLIMLNVSPRCQLNTCKWLKQYWLNIKRGIHITVLYEIKFYWFRGVLLMLVLTDCLSFAFYSEFYKLVLIKLSFELFELFWFYLSKRFTFKWNNRVTIKTASLITLLNVFFENCFFFVDIVLCFIIVEFKAMQFHFYYLLVHLELLMSIIVVCNLRLLYLLKRRPDTDLNGLSEETVVEQIKQIPFIQDAKETVVDVKIDDIVF
ncbi:Hypothetical_protein [Hexamita inflata]|uniref:Hypothetical_protein n=1 Tax=Hexamita inflata TaxID=28002 RepID=A0AA86PWI6_9EUKA|nr:Hypothetical protein HINF_LOCUS33072 [Hexamita inflata]